ncbi:MAG: FAD binding domain-containing protein, partial [Dehalococcoidia bacterium]|nr:FAD binding domain-containing protein [Dehalococcoidia bacterium]
MKTFAHINATTVNEAAAALGSGQAALVAGGTDLLGVLKDAILPSYPDTLVNLKTVTGLDEIKEEGGLLKIGALTKLSDIAKHTAIQEKYAALAQAAGAVGSPDLRNMGTIGGNICQRVRCWYYRASGNYFNCSRKSGNGICYALTGDHRFHSIFGAVASCMAVNPSDVAPALVALGADIVTNKRKLSAPDFFVPTGDGCTALATDEIVTEIQVPALPAAAKSAFVKFAFRKSIDFPIVNCAAVITHSGGTISNASIVLNAVAGAPRRATEAEDYLTEAYYGG